MHLDSANDTIGTMNRNEYMVKGILWIVVLMLAFANIIVLYFKFTRK